MVMPNFDQLHGVSKEKGRSGTKHILRFMNTLANKQVMCCIHMVRCIIFVWSLLLLIQKLVKHWTNGTILKVELILLGKVKWSDSHVVFVSHNRHGIDGIDRSNLLNIFYLHVTLAFWSHFSVTKKSKQSLVPIRPCPEVEMHPVSHGNCRLWLWVLVRPIFFYHGACLCWCFLVFEPQSIIDISYY